MLLINRDLWLLLFFKDFLDLNSIHICFFIPALHKANNTLKSLNSSETNKRNEKKKKRITVIIIWFYLIPLTFHQQPNKI